MASCVGDDSVGRVFEFPEVWESPVRGVGPTRPNSFLLCELSFLYLEQNINQINMSLLKARVSHFDRCNTRYETSVQEQISAAVRVSGDKSVCCFILHLPMS